MKNPLFGFLTVILLTPPVIAAEPLQLSGTRLELQARGAVRVVPDLVIIRAGVVSQAADAAGAMRDNAERMARVRAALRQGGIPDKQIQTEAMTLSPQYRYAQNEAPEITGYQASNTLSVRFPDIARSGAVLDALVRQGVNQIDGPQFVLDDRSSAEDRARVAAIKAVQAKADLYAKALGKTVRRIVSINEGADNAPPMPYLMARSAASAEAKTDIAPGEQDVAITVNAIFEID